MKQRPNSAAKQKSRRKCGEDIERHLSCELVDLTKPAEKRDHPNIVVVYSRSSCYRYI